MFIQHVVFILTTYTIMQGVIPLSCTTIASTPQCMYIVVRSHSTHLYVMLHSLMATCVLL